MKTLLTKPTSLPFVGLAQATLLLGLLGHYGGAIASHQLLLHFVLWGFLLLFGFCFTPAKLGRAALPMLGFFILVAWQVWQSALIWQASLPWLLYLDVLLFFWISTMQPTWAPRLWCWLGLLVALWSLLKTAWSPGSGWQLVSPLVNRNHFAAFLELLLFVPLALSLESEPRWLRRVLRGVTLLIALALLLTWSRGAYLALAVVVCLALLLSRHKTHFQSTRKVMLMLLLMVVLPLLAWTMLPGKTSTTGISMRLQLYQIAWRNIAPHPWLGSGPGVFANLFQKQFSGDTSIWQGDFVHNDYLQLLLEHGALGLALLLAVALLLFRGRHWSSRSLLIAMGPLALMIHALFDFVMHIPSTLLLFSWICGWLYCSDASTQALTSRPLKQRILTCAVLLLGALPCTYLAWQLDQFNPQGKIRSAELLRSRGEPLNALQLCSILNAYHPSSQNSILMAKLWEELAQLEKAQKAYQEALQLDPHNLLITELMGDFALRQGRSAQAITAYRQVLTVQPSRFNALLAKLQAANLDPLQIADLLPNEASSWRLWIDALSQQGYKAEALLQSQAAIERFPGCDQGFAERRITLLLELNQMQVATQELDEQLRSCGANRQQLPLLFARLRFREQKFDEAFGYLKQLLLNDPHQTEALSLVRQWTEVNPQLHESWRKVLEEVLQTWPDHSELQFALAQTLAAQKHWQEAVKLTKLLCGRDLRNLTYRKFLAKLYAEKQLYGQLISLYNEILAIEPNDTDTRKALEQLQAQLKQWSKP